MNTKKLSSVKGAEIALEKHLSNTDRQTKRRTYRQPQVHSFGSLEQVQSYYNGSYYDGPESSYWYDG